MNEQNEMKNRATTAWARATANRDLAKAHADRVKAVAAVNWARAKAAWDEADRYRAMTQSALAQADRYRAMAEANLAEAHRHMATAEAADATRAPKEGEQLSCSGS